MDCLNIHPLLEVPMGLVSLAREPLNLNADELQMMVDDLMEWWRKEEHLAEAAPKSETLASSFCERIIILARGSLEASKRKIDKILTTKTQFPDILLNRSFEEFEDFLDNAFNFPLPKINPVDDTRVTLINITTENCPNFSFPAAVRFGFLGGYGMRVKGIHFVNAPVWVDKVVNMLKLIVSEKIAKRIHVHKSMEELYEFIDRDVLPADYGGKLPSRKEIIEQWREYFKSEEAREILCVANALCSDESKRTDVPYSADYFGLPGSFKQIDID